MSTPIPSRGYRDYMDSTLSAMLAKCEARRIMLRGCGTKRIPTMAEIMAEWALGEDDPAEALSAITHDNNRPDFVRHVAHKLVPMAQREAEAGALAYE